MRIIDKTVIQRSKGFHTLAIGRLQLFEVPALVNEDIPDFRLIINFPPGGAHRCEIKDEISLKYDFAIKGGNG
ncbi:MAG: hypothetical protein JWN56_1318 [Sphingobacteriales bacterium]|nr:hypothetical protein [Sphingobacteriales bacterium]